VLLNLAVKTASSDVHSFWQKIWRTDGHDCYS